MRTKILLTAAAALAAGLVSSNAQVTSANVVGYVTVTSAGGSAFTLLANPLDNGSNTLSSLVTAPTGSHALVWNGTGFTSSTKTASSWSPNQTVPPGAGFFIQPTGANPVTNTFVGSVNCPVGGNVTNNLAGASANTLVGSPIPYADTLGGTNMNLHIPTGSHVLVWNGSGYTSSIKTASSFSPNPTITPGEGFFVQPTGPTYPWVQSLQ